MNEINILATKRSDQYLMQEKANAKEKKKHKKSKKSKKSKTKTNHNSSTESEEGKYFDCFPSKTFKKIS